MKTKNIIICAVMKNYKVAKHSVWYKFDNTVVAMTSFYNGGTWAESFWKVLIEERSLHIEARTKSLLQHETVGLPKLLSNDILCIYVYVVSTLKVRL